MANQNDFETELSSIYGFFANPLEAFQALGVELSEAEDEKSRAALRQARGKMIVYTSSATTNARETIRKINAKRDSDLSVQAAKNAGKVTREPGKTEKETKGNTSKVS